MTLLEIAVSFGVGVAFGIIVALLKLPVPAPGTLAGAAAVVGVTLGYLFVSSFV